MENFFTFRVPEFAPSIHESFNDLVRDPYLSFNDRYRRYGNYKLRMSDDGVRAVISRLAHKPYYQGKEYHKTLGGIDRHFEPIKADVTSIIAACSQKLPLSQEVDYFLRVHQFRTVVRRGQTGECVPEGPHRDGVEFAVMVSVSRTNITGGVSQVLESEEAEPCFEEALEPGTVLVVRDDRVYHNVTNIGLAADGDEGYRDVLLWGYIPWSKSRYKELYGDEVVEERTVNLRTLRWS
jgi:hypothetical protein